MTTHKLAYVTSNGTSPTPQAAYSDDGTTWTAATSTVHRANTSPIGWSRLAYSASRNTLVAVANDTPGASLTCMYSTDGGQTWTAATMPTAHAYEGICRSEDLDLFVAVGPSGDVATSPDGVTWTARTAASASAWQCVGWSPVKGTFVALSNGTATMYSTDGTTWNAGTIGTSSWLDICWCGGTVQKFAAAGSGTNIFATSTDGITWTAVSTFAGTSNSSVSCCWSEDLGVLLVGRNTTGVSKSTDASTGTTTAGSRYGGLCWSSALQLFVGVGTSGILATSALGVSWTTRTMPNSLSGTAVVALDVAETASSSGASSDRAAREAASSDHLLAEAASSDLLLRDAASSSDFKAAETWNPFDKSSGVVLSNGNATATSPAGSGYIGTRGIIGQRTGHRYFELKIPRIDQTSQFGVFGIGPLSQAFDNTVYAGTSGNGAGFTVIGEYGGGGHFTLTDITLRVAVDFVLRTTKFALNDGAWFGGTSRFATGTMFPMVIFGPSSLEDVSATLNLGNSPFTYPIPQGYESWDGLQGADSFADRIFNGLMVFATNSSSTSSAASLAWSEDGDTFTFSTTPTRTNGSAIPYPAIAYSPELKTFVALSNDSDSAAHASVVSSDGKTWAAHTLPANSQWNGIAWSPTLGLFVAVAGTGTDRAMWSADGHTWTLVSSADDTATWNDVKWCDLLGIFVAVGNGVVATSANGKTWTSRTSPVARNWTSIAFAQGFSSQGMIVVVADNSGTASDGFMYSEDGTTFNDIGQGQFTNQALIYSPDRNEILCTTASGGEPAIVMGPDLVAHHYDATWLFNIACHVPAWSAMRGMYYVPGSSGNLWRAADPTGAWDTVANPVIDGSGIVSIYEFDLRIESPSSQLASDLALQSDEQLREEASSSDKPAKDAASSDRVAGSDRAAADAASSDKPGRDAASSDKAILDAESSSDKPAKDAASSDRKPFEDASSSAHILFEEASSSDKLQQDASSSDFVAAREAGSSSNEILSNEKASSDAQEALREGLPPPIQVVVTIGS